MVKTDRISPWTKRKKKEKFVTFLFFFASRWFCQSGIIILDIFNTQKLHISSSKIGILPSRESVSFTAQKRKKTCVCLHRSLSPFGLGGDHTKAQAETYTSMWGKRGPKCQAVSLFSPFFARKKEKKGKSRFAHVKSPTLVTDARSLRLRVESYIPVPTKVLNHTHVWDIDTIRIYILCAQNQNLHLSQTFSVYLHTHTHTHSLAHSLFSFFTHKGQYP